MWRLYSGAGLFLAGVSAFIVDYRNRPRDAFHPFAHATQVALVEGLTPIAYDLIHVAGWALIISGVLLMVAGLIRYSVAVRHATKSS